ncbi:MAG TPA: hypothetical protein VKD71_08720 [Gemmataceae bacterium]|nr:hypothetical protein [Gemmataceae bacterium]
MNITLLMALVIGAPALKDKPRPEPSLEGEWKVERFNGGQFGTNQNVWIFSRDGIAEIRDPTGASVRSQLSYTLSPGDQIKAIDVLEFRKNGNAELRRGVYKIEGDTLTASFTVDNTPRPTTLDLSADCYVFVLKRVKK